MQCFNETVQPVIDVSQQEKCFYSLCLKDILRLCKFGNFHVKDVRKHLFPYDGNLNLCSKNTVNFIQCRFRDALRMIQLLIRINKLLISP